jgi:hypothetical protein
MKIHKLGTAQITDEFHCLVTPLLFSRRGAGGEVSVGVCVITLYHNSPPQMLWLGGFGMLK